MDNYKIKFLTEIAPKLWEIAIEGPTDMNRAFFNLHWPLLVRLLEKQSDLPAIKLTSPASILTLIKNGDIAPADAKVLMEVFGLKTELTEIPKLRRALENANSKSTHR